MLVKEYTELIKIERERERERERCSNMSQA
jgi:hypothetical protein